MASSTSRRKKLGECLRWARGRSVPGSGPAAGPLDAGLFDKSVAWAAVHCDFRLDVRYTMAVRINTKGMAAAIAEIDEDGWVEINYTPPRPSPGCRVPYKAGGSKSPDGG